MKKLTTPSFDAAYELKWSRKWPEFEQRPATILEFLDVGHLNVFDRTREAIKQSLVEMFGEEVNGDRIAEVSLAIMTGAIGIGKTTIASIVLPYMAHYVLCLADPQAYFNLMPGSRIAFMQMSTSEKQALEVVFGDIKARIQHSDWFQRNYTFDPKFKNQIRFVNKDIWIIPGDSHETTFEGYNILGGILDEADSHIVTATKDYADIGFDTIQNRIDSRFGNRGFLLVIGQMKKGDGFAFKKFEEFSQRDDAFAQRMTIWESFGEDHYRCNSKGPHKENPELGPRTVCGEVHKFPYDIKRKQVITPKLAEVLGSSENILWIPTLYQREFEVSPEKALKDLAGIPPAVGDPFIALPHKIEEAIDRWIVRYGPDSPVSPEGILSKTYVATDSIPRVGHIDIAYSGDGDALGFAMGHVQGVADIEGENKPYIVIDLVYRIKAPAGGEIFLQAVRQFIYNLKEGRKFKLKSVTTDGFQGVDTRQQLAARRIMTDVVSVDKDLVPYYDLRDALYEDRIELPPYMVHQDAGDRTLIPIIVKEMSELVDNGRKIDHPPLRGSKDVADAVAAVVFKLMGDRSFRRNVVSFETHRQDRQQKIAVNGGSLPRHPAILGNGARAPLPPTTWSP